MFIRLLFHPFASSKFIDDIYFQIIFSFCFKKYNMFSFYFKNSTLVTAHRNGAVICHELQFIEDMGFSTYRPKCEYGMFLRINHFNIFFFLE